MPFKKGISGSDKHKMTKGMTLNPHGRPKRLPDLDKLLADVLGEETADGRTAAEVILQVIRKKATGGDMRAAEVLFDRGYGKVKQSVDVTTLGNSVNQIDVSHLTFEQLKELKYGKS